jgi:hypothetical protein
MGIKKSSKEKAKRPAIFIYCTEELRRRIDRARRFTGRTISGYVLQCVKPQLEQDEADMKRRRLI